jgi:hypothetical protein
MRLSGQSLPELEMRMHESTGCWIGCRKGAALEPVVGL